MGIRWQRWMPFWPPLSPADKPTSIKHRGWYKYNHFYINLLNLTKPFDSSLKKWMRKAAHHSGGVVSSNPRRWRGEWLHHHGGGVCWLFVLLWMDSWRHETIVCKKWYKNNPKKRLCGVTFWPTLACTTPGANGSAMVLMFVDCCVGGGRYFLYYSYPRNPTWKEFLVPALTL